MRRDYHYASYDSKGAITSSCPSIVGIEMHNSGTRITIHLFKFLLTFHFKLKKDGSYSTLEYKNRKFLTIYNIFKPPPLNFPSRKLKKRF